MRDKVKINGVELTREQVESALTELNKPEPEPTVAHLTVVKQKNWPYQFGVVITGVVQRRYMSGLRQENGWDGTEPFTVVSKENLRCGGDSWSYASARDVLNYWTVLKEIGSEK